MIILGGQQGQAPLDPFARRGASESAIDGMEMEGEQGLGSTESTGGWFDQALMLSVGLKCLTTQKRLSPKTEGSSGQIWRFL